MIADPGPDAWEVRGTHANARRGMTDQVSGIASIRSSQFAVGSSKTSGAGNLQGLASMPALR